MFANFSFGVFAMISVSVMFVLLQLRSLLWLRLVSSSTFLCFFVASSLLVANVTSIVSGEPVVLLLLFLLASCLLTFESVRVPGLCCFRHVLFCLVYIVSSISCSGVLGWEFLCTGRQGSIPWRSWRAGYV